MNEELQILADQLKQKLHSGIVTFTFRKKDGTERKAVGTTKIELVPEAFRPKQKEASTTQEIGKSSTQTYFDVEKNAWRSLQKESLLSIVSHTTK
jgi:hypothetical protein